MSYEEKYGEIILDDREQELEQERIDKKERLENLESCLERIKEMIKSVNENDLEDLKDLLSEMKYEINSLE